uniref:Uncharacterized protein n=1 Tax=Anguilla anguilla TaxID=7936 RepID=A0A0E9XXG2_ANGAN
MLAFPPHLMKILKPGVLVSFLMRNKYASRSHKVRHDGFFCRLKIWQNL